MGKGFVNKQELGGGSGRKLLWSNKKERQPGESEELWKLFLLTAFGLWLDRIKDYLSGADITLNEAFVASSLKKQTPNRAPKSRPVARTSPIFGFCRHPFKSDSEGKAYGNNGGTLLAGK